MKKYISILFAALLTINMFGTDPSVTLTTYYANINGKSNTSDALRIALCTITGNGYTSTSYSNLKDDMYAASSNPTDFNNGTSKTLEDIYSSKAYTASQDGSSATSCGSGWNKEHTIPQSWFDEATPMKSDAHHVFPTDIKMNSVRSNYPYGENNASLSCSSDGYGHLGTSTFSGYNGTVFDPGAGGAHGSYKGDIARAYFYMVTRYRTTNFTKGTGNVCFTYTNNVADLTSYMKNLLLKWHREDPVSEKERIRNNAIYAHQHNRNPYIDYPELVEYIWGDKVGQSVALNSLTSGYVDGGSTPATYNVTLNRNGSITVLSGLSGTYTLPTASTETAACDGWPFAGWTTSSSVSGTTKPSFVTTVNEATTLYAVYSNTVSSAPKRQVMAATTETYGFENSDDATNWVINGPVKDNGMAATGLYSGKINTDHTYITYKNKVKVTNFSFKLARTSKNSNYNVYIETSDDGTSWTAAETYEMSSFSNGSFTTKSKNFDGETAYYVRFHCYNTTAVRYVDDISITYNTSSSGGTTTYKTSPDCSTLYSITLSGDGSTTGGYFNASGESAYAGATISLFADPADGYQFSTWTVTKAGGGTVSVSENTFTMPDDDVTISATFTPLTSYTIRFFNNGDLISSQSVYAGRTPNVPADPEGCDGYTFVGWWTTELGTSNTASKAWVTDFTVTSAKDYYAIYSHTEGTSSGGISTTNDVLTRETTGVTSGSSSYSNWSNKIGSSGAVYAGNSAGGNNAIQLRSNNSNSGIITTTSGGKATKVAVTWESNTQSGRTLDIYGKNNAYSAASDLYSNSTSTQGTKIGSIVYGTSTELTISSDYAYIGFRSKDGALYLTNVTITWSTSGGSTSTTYYTSTTNCASACTALETPAVTAVGSNGQIILTWADVADADHYTVAISKGAGYTTECGSTHSIGTISHSGTTNTCVITGLTNGLAYTTTVVANASSSTCDSEADSDTTTPQECTQWDDPTLGWNKYKLNTTTAKTATVTVSGTTHGTLSFESSNTDVLTVDSSTGTVTAQGAGEATVTAHWMAADGYCEKTMTSQAFEVAGPLTINFDTNGGTGTMTDQTVTYKVSTAIKDNSFTRTGYTFQGWALTADGEKVYNDKQSVAFTNSLTLYAVWMLNSHKVTFTPAPTGATVKVNNSSTSPVNNVNYGSTVTIAITPADHYTVSALTVSSTSGSVAVSGTGDTRTFTMPDEDVTVALTMEAESQFTATFHNGTATFATVDGYVDDDINAPTGTPSSCDDETFTFVGWVAAEQTTETTTMPEIVSFPQNMLSGGVDYYALFRRTEGGGGGEASVTFKTASSDASTAYTDDSDIKANLVESYTGISSFAGSKAYLGKSGVKLGASSGSGYITLNLSSPITTDEITVEAVKYGTDGGNLKIEINGSTAFGSELSPADGTLNFTDNEVEISSLTILTTAKRAYVASISLGGGGTSYYTTAPECAVCESQVTITKGAETNGTFTLSKADGTYDNCKKNVSVIVSNITPADGYYCTGVTATGNPMHMAVSGPDASGNYTVAYAKNYSFTSTITANFEEIPTHTVTWSVLGGEEISSATYREGATISFPADPTGCEDKEFVGWTTEPILFTDEEPTLVTSATMGTEDITFYAVFATASEGAPMLTNNYKKITSTSELTDGNYLIVAYYNNGYKAMSTTWKDTYYLDSEDVTPSDDVITTTDGTIIWNIAVSNNQATIYNATSGYLHIEKSGSYYNIKLGDNTTANKFTYSVSSGNWLFTSVTYTDRVLEYYSSRTRWAYYTAADAPVYLYKQQYASGTTTYSGYTTLCYEKYERTFNNVEDYATLCLPYSVNVLYLQGATAYSVAGKYVNNSTITGILLNEEETELAAGQSYVIQSTALTMNAWYSPRVDSLKAPVDTQGMVGNLSGKKIYVPVGCYGLSHNKLRKVASENTASIDHYKAYFILNDDEEVPVVEESTIPQGSKVMHTTDDAPTALEQTNGQPSIDWNQPVYNILGIRVGKDATGVLIQNGIKYLR